MTHRSVIRAASILLLGIAAVLPPSPAAGVPAPIPGDPPTPARERGAEERVREGTGLVFSVLESRIRRRLIRTRTPYGFKIRRVDAESAAARSGLRPADILLEWDGRPIRTVAELARWVDAASSGQRVRILYARRTGRATIWNRRPWDTREGELVVRRLF